MKIGNFLAEGKSVTEFDEFTKLCYAMVQLKPLESGMRLDTQGNSNATAMQIIQENEGNSLVKSLIAMNSELASRKTSLSESDLKKKFRSLLGQVQAQATRTNEVFKPQGFAWFHRTRGVASAKAREECIAALNQALENLK